MRGRKPKPTAVKLAEGNPGKRPLNEHEPKPEAKAPACPPTLKGSARAEWQRIAPELERLGLLTRIDRAALATYCSAWGTYVDASKELDGKKLWVVTKSGNTIPHPCLGIRNTAMKMVMKFCIEFGLTPSSRSRVTANPNDDQDDDVPGYEDKPALKYHGV